MWLREPSASFSTTARGLAWLQHCGRVPRPLLVVASYAWLNIYCPGGELERNLEIPQAEVLKLAPADRSHLLERLIAGLDADPEVEEAWKLEADRRKA